MAKKVSKSKKRVSASKTAPVDAVSLKLTLNDLKQITAAGSSFGGDTWQKIKWGKIDIGLEPIEARASAATLKKRARKT